MYIRYVQKRNQLEIPKLMSRKKVGIWASVVLLGFLLTVCSCNPYKAGWISIASALSARNAVDDGVSKTFRVKMDQCKKTHKEGVTPYHKCMTDSQELKAMVIWRSYARPTITAGARAAFEALVLAEKIDQDKDQVKSLWIQHLKAGVCALTKMITDFKDLFPDKALIALSYLDLVKGVVCK